MKADLHLHSTASDGSWTPHELVFQCLRHGLTHISLTDHDTTAGQEEAAAAGREYGIKVIPGIELSAYDFERGSKVHLLGFNFQPPAGNLKALCSPLLTRRHERTVSHIRILQQAGYPISLGEVEAAAAPSSILYKQHIMKVFMEKGLSTAIYSPLYGKLFKGDGICGADIEYTDMFDALAAVIGDGGSAVLAHPGQQNNLDLAERLAAAGLEGIELNHVDNSAGERMQIEKTAAYLGLFLTGGSDSHGDLGPAIAPGDYMAPESLEPVLNRWCGERR